MKLQKLYYTLDEHYTIEFSQQPYKEETDRSPFYRWAK